MDGSKQVTAVACAATILVLLGLRVPALAKDKCQADAQKFCAGMTSGNQDYADCLQQHAKQLSKACKNQVGAAQARANDLKQFHSCVADAETLCPGTKPGSGRVMMCLRTHQTDLSSACMQELRDHGELH